MKKLLFAGILSALAAACMFKPLPEVVTLGEVQIPVATEEAAVWSATDYEGKPVLIMFMGSWCPYCKMSMSALNSVAEKFNGKVEIVAAFADGDLAPVTAVIKEHGLTAKALYNSREAIGLLGVSGFPHTVLFNKKHQLVKVWEGFSPTLEQEFTEQLNKLTK